MLRSANYLFSNLISSEAQLFWPQWPSRCNEAGGGPISVSSTSLQTGVGELAIITVATVVAKRRLQPRLHVAISGFMPLRYSKEGPIKLLTHGRVYCTSAKCGLVNQRTIYLSRLWTEGLRQPIWYQVWCKNRWWGLKKFFPEDPRQSDAFGHNRTSPLKRLQMVSVRNCTQKLRIKILL